MKILFLDIDGVCNSAAYVHKRFEETGKAGIVDIDPVAAARVKRIIKETGCKVVLSSTWRLMEHNREEVRREVCDFIDVTPHYGGRPRGEEVRDWLIAHPLLNVVQRAILDDDSDFLPGQPLFQTTWAAGLTDEIADAVIAHLNI